MYVIASYHMHMEIGYVKQKMYKLICTIYVAQKNNIIFVTQHLIFN